MEWWILKEHLSEFTGLSKDALHIHAAMIIQVGVALLLRSSLDRPLPWLTVLVILCANEWYDLTLEVWPNRSAQYWNSFHDIWNTMVLPTLAGILVRFAPFIFISARDNERSHLIELDPPAEGVNATVHPNNPDTSFEGRY